MDKAASILEHLQHVAKIFPAPLYWLDRNNVVLGVSATVIHEVGAPNKAEFIGKTAYDLYPPPLAEKIIQHNNQVIRTGKISAQEEAITDLATGEIKYFMAVKAPLRNDAGEIIGLVGTSVDITDRKKIEFDLRLAKEAAEVANKAKTEFLENIRHDLRTPLTGIVGFSGLIKTEALKTKNEKILSYADSVQASSQALLELLNEVLEAMRIASGERPLLKKKFNLKTKIKQVINLNLSKARQKKLKLLFNCDENIPIYLVGDPKRIQRIVLELVTNALNFTEHGKVEVSIKLAKLNADTRDVIIQIIVSDTGMGIPPNRQQEVFERFQRLTPSYEGTYKGLGLGLAIVKQFIDDLGGEIFLESALNKGSTFICTIPLKVALLSDSFDADEERFFTLPKSQQTRKQHPILSKAVTPSSKVKSYILLVEDDPIAARVVKSLLNDLKCEVEWAKNGVLALEAIEKQSYDLILMDVGLPDIDGKEVTRRIRDYESIHGAKKIPIIALTAHVGLENKEACLQAGMNAVLSKPLSNATALDILQAVIPKALPLRKHRGTNSGNQKTKSLKLPTQVIDLKLGTKLMGGKLELAKAMLKMLVKESLPESLKALQAAHAKADWETIRNAAHKLHGGVSYCGAPRLKAAVSNLENYLRKNETQDREMLYAQLLKEINTLKINYVKNFDT